MGKASHLALVEIRKSMTKENRRINGSCLKAVKIKHREKHESFFKERNSFLMT